MLFGVAALLARPLAAARRRTQVVVMVLLWAAALVALWLPIHGVCYGNCRWGTVWDAISRLH